jgi:hypothetical protein
MTAGHAMSIHLEMAHSEIHVLIAALRDAISCTLECVKEKQVRATQTSITEHAKLELLRSSSNLQNHVQALESHLAALTSEYNKWSWYLVEEV